MIVSIPTYGTKLKHSQLTFFSCLFFIQKSDLPFHLANDVLTIDPHLLVVVETTVVTWVVVALGEQILLASGSTKWTCYQ